MSIAISQLTAFSQTQELCFLELELFFGEKTLISKLSQLGDLIGRGETLGRTLSPLFPLLPTPVALASLSPFYTALHGVTYTVYGLGKGDDLQRRL